MCLAVPMKVIEINDDEAVVELDGFQKEVNIILIDKIKPGDFVMVHAGFAIQKVNPDEAEITLNVLREYSQKIENIK